MVVTIECRGSETLWTKKRADQILSSLRRKSQMYKNEMDWMSEAYELGRGNVPSKTNSSENTEKRVEKDIDESSTKDSSKSKTEENKTGAIKRTKPATQNVTLDKHQVELKEKNKGIEQLHDMVRQLKTTISQKK